MRDGTENVAELELLRAERVRLAGRLKTPWWYIAGTAFTLAVAFAMPIGSHYITGAGIAGTLLAIVMFCSLQYALARFSGVDLGTRTLRRYPSGRPWGLGMIALIPAATGAETLIVDHGLLAAVIVVGVLATLAGTVCWLGHLRGIRQDLGTGRGAT